MAAVALVTKEALENFIEKARVLWLKTPEGPARDAIKDAVLGAKKKPVVAEDIYTEIMYPGYRGTHDVDEAFPQGSLLRPDKKVGAQNVAVSEHGESAARPESTRLDDDGVLVGTEYRSEIESLNDDIAKKLKELADDGLLTSSLSTDVEPVAKIPMNFKYGEGEALPGTQPTTFDEIFKGSRTSTLRKVGQVSNRVKPGTIVEVVGDKGRTGLVEITGRRPVVRADAEALSETERWTPEFLRKYMASGKWEQITYKPVDHSSAQLNDAQNFVDNTPYILEQIEVALESLRTRYKNLEDPTGPEGRALREQAAPYGIARKKIKKESKVVAELLDESKSLRTKAIQESASATGKLETKITEGSSEFIEAKTTVLDIEGILDLHMEGRIPGGNGYLSLEQLETLHAQYDKARKVLGKKWHQDEKGLHNPDGTREKNAPAHTKDTKEKPEPLRVRTPYNPNPEREALWNTLPKEFDSAKALKQAGYPDDISYSYIDNAGQRHGVETQELMRILSLEMARSKDRDYVAQLFKVRKGLDDVLDKEHKDLAQGEYYSEYRSQTQNIAGDAETPGKGIWYSARDHGNKRGYYAPFSALRERRTDSNRYFSGGFWDTQGVSLRDDLAPNLSRDAGRMGYDSVQQAQEAVFPELGDAAMRRQLALETFEAAEAEAQRLFKAATSDIEKDAANKYVEEARKVLEAELVPETSLGSREVTRVYNTNEAAESVANAAKKVHLAPMDRFATVSEELVPDSVTALNSFYDGDGTIAFTDEQFKDLLYASAVAGRNNAGNVVLNHTPATAPATTTRPPGAYNENLTPVIEGDVATFPPVQVDETVVPHHVSDPAVLTPEYTAPLVPGPSGRTNLSLNVAPTKDRGALYLQKYMDAVLGHGPPKFTDGTPMVAPVNLYDPVAPTLGYDAQVPRGYLETQAAKDPALFPPLAEPYVPYRADHRPLLDPVVPPKTSAELQAELLDRQVQGKQLEQRLANERYDRAVLDTLAPVEQVPTSPAHAVNLPREDNIIHQDRMLEHLQPGGVYEDLATRSAEQGGVALPANTTNINYLRSEFDPGDAVAPDMLRAYEEPPVEFDSFGNPVFRDTVSTAPTVQPVNIPLRAVGTPDEADPVQLLLGETREIQKGFNGRPTNPAIVESLATKSDIPPNILMDYFQHAPMFEAVGPLGDKAREVLGPILKKYPQITFLFAAAAKGALEDEPMIGLGVPAS